MARVLVIEDDPDIRDIVVMTLERDHEVEAVVDARVAPARLAEQSYDVAVVDRMLPGVSGMDLLAAARADARLAGLPIIMLTARARPHEVQEGLDAGATAYITKPFSPRALAELVDDVVATPMH